MSQIFKIVLTILLYAIGLIQFMAQVFVYLLVCHLFESLQVFIHHLEEFEGPSKTGSNFVPILSINGST